MRTLAVTLALLVIATTVHANVIYVDIDALGVNDGSSWADAYVDLNDALSVATYGEEVRVAGGNYSLHELTGPWTYRVPSGIKLLGGYDPNTSPTERNWVQHRTRLFTPRGVPESPLDRSVLSLIDCDSNTVVDGLWLVGEQSRFYTRGVVVVGGAPTVRDCRISRFWSSPPLSGAGMHISGGSSATLERVEFWGNRSDASGGGVYVTDSRVSITGGWFRVNFASQIGGAVYHAGGPFAETAITVLDCDFTGNGAQFGAAALESEAHHTVITNCVFQKNLGTRRATALSINSTDARLSYCILDSNRMATFGLDNPLTHRNAALENFGQLQVTACEFTANMGRAYGSGGVAAPIVNWGTLEMVGSLVAGNYYYGGQRDRPSSDWELASAGAIANGGHAVLSSNTITDNYAWAAGAIISLPGSQLSAANCVIADNAQKASGPPVYRYDSGLIVWSNSLVQESGGSGPSWSPEFGGDGGDNIDEDPLFIDAETGDFRLSPCSPAIDRGDNAAVADVLTDLDGNPRIQGAAVDLGAYESPARDLGSILYVDADATGKGCGTTWADAFTDLQDALRVAVAGYQIWVADGTYSPTQNMDWEATFNLVNQVSLYGGFRGDEATREARDFDAFESILTGYLGVPPAWRTISDFIVTAVDIDSTTCIDGFTIRDGAHGLLIEGGNPRVLNSKITRNVTYGGGHSAGATLRGSCRPLFANVDFVSNHAIGDGGGINDRNLLCRPLLLNVVFDSNIAAGFGGGMRGMGDFNNVEFRNNSSSNSGGGLNGGGTLADVTFVANQTANYGAGMLVIRGPGFSGSSAGMISTLTRVKFIRNFVYGPGGGGGLSGGAIVTDAIFKDNVAPIGGGMYSERGGSTLTNALFIDNEAYYQGGAAVHVGVGPTEGYRHEVEPTFFSNVTVTANRATYSSALPERVSAVFSRFGEIEMVNSIVWGNQNLDAALVSVRVEEAASRTSHSLVEGSGGSGAGWSPNFGIDLGGNLDTDPLFVDASGGDLRLAPGSPAINAGDSGAVPVGIETDLDGNPRFIGAAVDMGAYEFQGSVKIADPPDKPELVQRYLYATPNPFNPSTTISYGLPAAGRVELSIFDLAGRRVRVLVNEHVSSGDHEAQWHGRDESGKQVASGVYLYQLRAGEFVETKRMVLLK